jgi:hypothetical protein
MGRVGRSTSHSSKPTMPAVVAPAASAKPEPQGTTYSNIDQHTGGSESTPCVGRSAAMTTRPARSAMMSFGVSRGRRVSVRAIGILSPVAYILSPAPIATERQFGFASTGGGSVSMK